MRFPKLPKSLLKPPPGFKKPNHKDFVSDMERLGEEIAEEFKEKVVSNIENNEYGFELSESTIRGKKSDIPLINSGQLVDAIYREGTTVSVEDTPREDSSLTNLELAIIHEYGTKDKHIPARPVWRNTFRDFKDTAHKRVSTFLEDQKFKRHEGDNNKVSHKKR